jgi:SH3-like domain-containing protein
MSLRRLSPFALVLPLAAAGGFALLPAKPEDANARLAAAQVEPVQPSYLAVPIATVDPLPVRTAEKPAPVRPSLTVTTASIAPPAASVVPAAAEPDVEPKELAHVGSSALNVRAGPSSSTAKLFVLQPGTQVATAESDGSWVRIVTSDGQEGWVFRRYLSTGAAAQEPAATEVSRAVARDAVTEVRTQQRTARIAGRVPLRAAPSGRSERLFVLEPGERVVIAEQRGRWARVIVDGGVSGWVRLN